MEGRVKKITRRVAITLGVVLLVLAAAVLFLESAWFRGWLEGQASAQLGREVVIVDHGIDWGVPLTLRLSEVRVANVRWAEEPMARFDELTVTLNVGALLQRELELERIGVIRPQIRLLRREDGTTNVSDLLDQEPTEEQASPLWPEAFAIEQGRLLYRDAARDVDLDIAFETLGESVDELSLDVHGKGHAQDASVQLQGRMHLELEERRGRVEAFQGRIGESRLEGRLALDLGRDAPRVAAELDGDALDLDRWGLFETSEKEVASPQDGTPQETWDRRAAQVLESMEAFEADLDLSLGRLHYAGQSLHDLSVSVTLEEGRLSIARLQALQQLDEETPRSLNVQGWLEVEEQRLVADLQAQLDRIDLTAALAPLGLGRLGTLNGNLNTRVTGGGLLFEDTALDYRNPHWGLALSFSADTRTENVEGRRIHLGGEGRYEQEPFTFDLLIGPLLDLTHADTPYPISGDLTSGETRLWIDGSVVQPFALEALEGNFRLEGPSPAELTELTGIALPELPPYRVNGYLRYQDDLLTVNELDGGFGDSDVAGDVRLRFGARPKLWATLVSQQLEADDLLPLFGMSPKTGPSETESAEQRQWEAEERRTGKLFPDRAWNLEALRNTDIVLDYEASDVQAEHVPFEDLELALELEQGVMTVDPLLVGLGGGRVRASWVMDARQAALEGDLQLALDQVNLRALLDEAGLPDVARDTLGVFGGRGDFRYHGRSMHEVMAGLDGELELAMSQGWLDIIAAELLPLNVANALVAALTGEEQVQLECTYVRFVADDGLADLANFFMATEIAHFEGAGAINLATERMDMAFQGHNVDPTLFTGNSPVELKGTLRDPEVNVITEELVARGALSLLGALVAPPLAILPWVDPGDGEQVGMGCERALSAFEE